MLTIAAIEHIGRIAEAPLQFVDHLRNGLAGGGTEDTLVDEEPGDGPRAVR